MKASEFLNGYWIELECQESTDPLTGFSIHGHLQSVDLPFFSVVVGLQGWLFRSDENLELAVREVDRSLWEIISVTQRGAN